MKNLYTLLLFILTITFSHAQWAGFNNSSGDGVWSNNANWAFPAGVTELAPNQAIDIYAGPATATLDVDCTAKSLRIPGNKPESFTLTGDKKLTIDIASGSQANNANGAKAFSNESEAATTLTIDTDVTIANTATIESFKGVSVFNVSGHPDSKIVLSADKTLEITGTGTSSFWGIGEIHLNGTITGNQGILVGGGAGSGLLYLGSSTSDVSGFTGALTLANNSELTLNSNGSSTISNAKVQQNGAVAKLTLERENVLTPNEIRVSSKGTQAYVLNMFVNANQTLGGIKIKGGGSTLNLNIDTSVASVVFASNNANWNASAVINIIGYREGVVSFGGDNTGLNGGAYLANIRIDGAMPDGGEPLSLDENGKLVGAASLALSTGNNNGFEFLMYPNPVNDVLNIKSQEDIENIEVLDLVGRTIISQNNGTNRFDVSSLNNGVYIVKLTSSQGVSTQRIIKE
tara:strand:+ start:5955 stop:7334 length:1380 start_codon:yes stop_codon:yes gene_type:complete